ncbi:hypothetical protein CE91St42_35730 [Oscillospiraceae bacterium]|nr:hypothetical protein CE91St42_35730 [Oscillospiraceae bacterium]
MVFKAKERVFSSNQERGTNFAKLEGPILGSMPKLNSGKIIVFTYVFRGDKIRNEKWSGIHLNKEER